MCSSLEAEGTYSPLIFLCALPVFMNFCMCAQASESSEARANTATLW